MAHIYVCPNCGATIDHAPFAVVTCPECGHNFLANRHRYTINTIPREFVQGNPVASMFIIIFGVFFILHQLFGYHGWFLVVAVLSYILVAMWAD